MTSRQPVAVPVSAPDSDLPPGLLDFEPVPRRYRHNGWTPERQKAFIGWLAVTGCVDRAARMVNIAQTNCYELRRAPGAEGFRRAWDAALDFAVPKLKDIAFQRAIEGELVPVFSGGKLMGFRRKYNDRLLMFCLRHYGQDASGKRTTINYFSTRASAGAAAGPGAGEGASTGAQAEASATTVRTVITGPADREDERGARGDSAAAVLGAFEGVPLDPEAEAAIAAALEACAERARAADLAIQKGGDSAALATADDPGTPFVRAGLFQGIAIGAIEPAVPTEEFVPFAPGEAPWELAGAETPAWPTAIEAKPGSPGEPGGRCQRRGHEAGKRRDRASGAAKAASG
ncbi:MAG TPA: hypothetical protein VF548_13490 [Allosphingosinicella sp.]|jgi:hypothetical protein